MLTSSASADFVGLDASAGTLVIGQEKFHVVDVYAKFSDPSDRMLLVWNTEIHLHAAPGAKFFHATLPGGIVTAKPVCYTGWSELWEADTYICIGGSQCDTSGVQCATPDLPNNLLVNSDGISTPGGWFNVPPFVAADGAGSDLRVRLCRLSIRNSDWEQAAFVACSWTIGWKSMSPCWTHFDSGAIEVPFVDGAGSLPDDMLGAELTVGCSGGYDGGGGYNGGGGGSNMWTPPAPIGPVEANDLLWLSPGGFVMGWTLDGFTYESASCVGNPVPMSLMPGGRGDADGDGDDDLIFFNMGDHSAQLWTLEGGVLDDARVLGPAPNPEPWEWKILAVTDLNGDGQVDILWRHEGQGELGSVRAWIIDEGQVIKDKLIGLSPGFEFLALGDFDDDGNPDILWRLPNNYLIAWKLHGSAPATALVFGGTPAVPANWKIETACDLDADGDADLVWRNANNGQVKGWTVQNFARTSAGVIKQVLGAHWKFIASPDLDGDGDADLVWLNHDTGLVNRWEMQGLQKLSSGVIFQLDGGDWQTW